MIQFIIIFAIIFCVVYPIVRAINNSDDEGEIVDITLGNGLTIQGEIQNAKNHKDSRNIITDDGGLEGKSRAKATLTYVKDVNSRNNSIVVKLDLENGDSYIMEIKNSRCGATKETIYAIAKNGDVVTFPTVRGYDENKTGEIPCHVYRILNPIDYLYPGEIKKA